MGLVGDPLDDLYEWGPCSGTPEGVIEPIRPSMAEGEGWRLARVTGLGHVAIYAEDLIRPRDFSTRVLGLRMRGRFLLGVERGYQVPEFDVVNAPQDASRAMFMESVDIIKLAFTEDNFSYNGGDEPLRAGSIRTASARGFVRSCGPGSRRRSSWLRHHGHTPPAC